MARDSRMRQVVKRKPPSRVRYEQGHPTVSCRVPREIYERLQAAKTSEGKSFADILKIGLGLIEVKAKDEAEIRKKADAEGYKKGYAYAEGLYKVTYPCVICQKAITVTSQNAKQAIKSYMQENNWGHQACHDKRR